LRIPVSFVAIFVVSAWLFGCGGGPVDPPPEVKIVNGEAYFPMHDGDVWNYTQYTPPFTQITRHVDGDTTVNGVLCKRILKGPDTDQAWSLTAQRFAQHLFEGYLWFDPPLNIPLDMVKGKPVQFSSLGRISDAFQSDADSIRTAGSLSFDGYITRTVNEVSLDSCLKFDYDYIDKVYLKNGTVIEDTSRYSEIWARGIGMIDDGDLILDMAIINGIQVP
jgi:hypothetical protein